MNDESGESTEPIEKVALTRLGDSYCRICCCGASRAVVDRYILPAGPTAANPPHAAATGESDRQTDGHSTVT